MGHGARSAYTQLRYSPWPLAGTLAGLAWLYVLPPASAIAGAAALAGSAGRIGAGRLLCAAAGAACWAAMAISYLPMLRLYRLSPLRAPTLPAIALMYAAMTADWLAALHGPGRRLERPGGRPGERESTFRKRHADSR